MARRDGHDAGLALLAAAGEMVWIAYAVCCRLPKPRFKATIRKKSVLRFFLAGKENTPCSQGGDD